MLVFNFNEQAVDYGECERKSQRNGGSFSPLAADVDIAPQSVNGPLYHIHTDPTSRNTGDTQGCGKAGSQNECKKLLICGLSIRRDQSSFHRFGANHVQVEPCAIIFNLNDDISARMHGRKMNSTMTLLACRKTCFRRLNAVTDAIADQVHEGIIKAFYDGF